MTRLDGVTWIIRTPQQIIVGKVFPIPTRNLLRLLQIEQIESCKVEMGLIGLTMPLLQIQNYGEELLTLMIFL